MRPVDDHLGGVGEPLRGGEHRTGIADRHLVAEEPPLTGQRGGEVRRPEDDHPWWRGEAAYQQGHPRRRADQAGPPGREQVAAGPGGDGVQRRVTQRRRGSRRPVERRRGPDRPTGRRRGPDGTVQQQPPAHARRRPGHAGDRRDRTAPVHRRAELVQRRCLERTDPLHVHLDAAPTGQTRREHLVVGVTEAGQSRRPGVEHRTAQVVDGGFDAAGGNAAGHGGVRGDQHRTARWPGCAAGGRGHRGQRHRFARDTSAHRLVEHWSDHPATAA